MFQNEYKIIHSALVVRIGHEEKIRIIIARDSLDHRFVSPVVYFRT